MRLRTPWVVALAVVAVMIQAAAQERATGPAKHPLRLPASPRLYVFDGGTLGSDPERYRLKKEEVGAVDLSVLAFLIAHPKGLLLWDTGAIADDSWTPTGKAVEKRLVLSNGAERKVTLRTSLKAQLAASGYSPADITYLGLSHFHWDHVANANMFAGATWLARSVERKAMFPDEAPEVPQPSVFADLKNSKTVAIPTDDYDVFGDGTVVMKLAKGHTPGHQVLYVKLPKTGGVVLSGDLYHYPEERTLHRLPIADVDQEQTRRSREQVEAFLQQSGAKLWIQHDLRGSAKLKKSPAYYD
jgi:N-acyl homoserine lactone hydrolase